VSSNKQTLQTSRAINRCAAIRFELTTRSRFVLEKLTVLKLVRKFRLFYGARMFITVFKTAATCPNPPPYQSTSDTCTLHVHYRVHNSRYMHPTILMLTSHLHESRSSGPSPGSPIKNSVSISLFYHTHFCVPSIPLIHVSNISNTSNVILPCQRFSVAVARYNGTLRTF
jgi:hypothetical protein